MRPWRVHFAFAALGAFAVFGLALGGSPAVAQVGFSTSLTSDEVFRGLSLSDGRPAVTVTAVYDDRGGAYVGASAIGADTARAGFEALGYQAYAGYARRLAPGSAVSWDIGATNSDLTEHLERRYHANYSEAFLGLNTKNVRAYLYYSPNYLGADVSTLYLDLEATRPVSDHWRLFAHAGVLAALNNRATYGFRNPQFDLRAGVAAVYGRGEWRLAWTEVDPDAYYPGDHTQARDRLTASVSYFF